MKKIVLTGGPHSGKSTLLSELEKIGHRVIPEAAIQVITHLEQVMGFNQSIEWREKNFEEFQHRILDLQELQESKIKDEPGVVFIDRGRYDSIAFCRLFNKNPSRASLEKITAANYDGVVLLDLILPFSSRKETGRIEDEVLAKKVSLLLRAVYEEQGFKTLHLPQEPLQDRMTKLVNFVETL